MCTVYVNIYWFEWPGLLVLSEQLLCSSMQRGEAGAALGRVAGMHGQLALQRLLLHSGCSLIVAFFCISEDSLKQKKAATREQAYTHITLCVWEMPSLKQKQGCC